MKCHALREAIVELARTGDAGAGTRAAIESHLEHCSRCTALIVRERQLSDGLRALAAATTAAAPGVMERRLLDVFVERQAAAHSTVAIAGPSSARRWLAAAAALLLTAGLMAWLWTARNGAGRDVRDTANTVAAPLQKEVQKEVQKEAPRPGSLREPDAVARAVADTDRASHSVAADRPRPSATRGRARPSPVVRAAGFVALPGAVGLPDFESGQIIRMEIPLTSLPTYGIEIQPDAQGVPVEADLLVGQDGQPRAIRLVTTSASR